MFSLIGLCNMYPADKNSPTTHKQFRQRHGRPAVVTVKTCGPTRNEQRNTRLVLHGKLYGADFFCNIFVVMKM